MSDSLKIHIVQANQTLSEISDLHGISVNDLILLNGKESLNINEGQKLLVEKPDNFYEFISQNAQDTPTPSAPPTSTSDHTPTPTPRPTPTPTPEPTPTPAPVPPLRIVHVLPVVPAPFS